MTAQSTSRDQPWLDVVGSRYLLDWLDEENVSLAYTTYQTGKLMFVGRKPDRRLGVFERTFERCLGLWGDAQTLWMSSQFQIWRFENVLQAGQNAEGYDRLYVPQVGYTTGDVDAHDMAVDAAGRVIFVNTLFGCLATVSERYSFQPLWRPAFLSKLAAEDRCHLNGLAMHNGQPKFVTAVSQSDVADGWRDRRHDGGCVIDVASNEIVCAGLSMPHSPRLYRDRLWLLNSGTGGFGWVDPAIGRFEPVAFCPGCNRTKQKAIGRRRRTMSATPLTSSGSIRDRMMSDSNSIRQRGKSPMPRARRRCAHHGDRRTVSPIGEILR